MGVLKELRELAVSAEVEKFDPHQHTKQLCSIISIYPSQCPKLSNLPSQLEPWSLRDPKKKDTPAAQSQYRCGICGMRNYLTTMCLHKKKEGCWRYGGKHMLKECRVPFPCSAPRTAATNEDSSRNAVLAMVTHDIPRTASK